MDSLTSYLWTGIKNDIYPAILSHPFLQGLTRGDLSEAAFQYYVCQDSAYLAAFGRGLAILASRSDGSGDFMMFCEHARNTLVVEAALHREFLEGFANYQRPPQWNDLSPNGLLYTSYLTRVARERPYYEAVAAFLPCYWIYRRVGEHLVAQGSPNALYQRWIDTYSGEAFGEVVRQMLSVVDTLDDHLPPDGRARMRDHFRRTSELEYMFWDAAYSGQKWPFGLHSGI
jgi:thiaminase/transcriptional activator TenA